MVSKAKSNGGVSGSAPELALATPKIDFTALAVTQDFASLVGTRRTAITVPVEKPRRKMWVQLHPEWRYQAVFLEMEEERTFYIVEPHIIPDIRDDCSMRVLVPWISREGSLGLWPIRLPGEDGRSDTYSASALVLVRKHAGKWIRVLANQQTKAYEIQESGTDFPPPQWPEGGMEFILALAFEDRIICSRDHAVLQKLGGWI
jgi:hypothetical protein